MTKTELGSQSWQMYVRNPQLSCWAHHEVASMALVPQAGQKLTFVGELEPVRVLWVCLETRELGVQPL